MKSVGDPRSITKQGWHLADCELCAKPTWHYKMAGDTSAATCSNHSDYKGKPRPIVSGAIAMLAKLTPDHGDAPTERELRIVNQLDRSLWRNAEESSARVCIADQEWAQDLFSASAPMKDPNKLYCSFCAVEVDRINVSTEKKPKILWKQDAYKTASGEIVMEEKRITQMETVHACPNCVVKIRKPIVVHRI